MTSNANLFDDDIDIRALLHTLFRYKWVILGFTLVALVAVFVFSKFGSPKMYMAQAQVLFTKPLFTTNLDPSIQSTPQTPEASVLKDLALDDELLQNVYSSPEVNAALGADFKFSRFQSSLSARVTGTSKLYLVAIHQDSQISALIVNVWAEKFTTKINALYSVNEKSLNMGLAKEAARQKWQKLEQDLLDKLHDAMADTRKIELVNKQNSLASYLNTSTQLDLIILDAQSLQMRLAIWPDNSKLGIEYQVSLINVYQKATGGLAGTLLQGAPLQGMQLQIQAPTVDNTRTVAEAEASLGTFIDSLADQKNKLQDRAIQLQQEIYDATIKFESENYLLTQLTTERDLALEAYKAVSAQMEEIGIDPGREDVIARQVGQAQPAANPVSNRTLTKTLIAGAMAFIIACFGVLFLHWWKSPAPEKSTGDQKK